jgi:hypothetical protein
LGGRAGSSAKIELEFANESAAIDLARQWVDGYDVFGNWIA